MGRFNQGRGAGRGRGNRASKDPRKNRNNQNSNQSNSRRGLGDYVYSLGKQAADYDIITKFLILHIRKTYLNGDDIGNALENQQETEFNAPILEVSSSTDAAIKARENKQYEMIFEAKLALYLKQEETYRTNKGKAYAFIFGQCNKSMHNVG